MDKNLIEILRKSALFEGVWAGSNDSRDSGENNNEESFLKLIDCLGVTTKHFFKNEIILLTGDAVTHIGIILQGSAHAYLEDADGSSALISTLGPLSLFGEILVSTKTHKSPVTVYAKTDLTAAFIDYKKISPCSAFCPLHRILPENIAKSIGDKYFVLFERLEILRKKSIRAKIKTYLYTLSDRGKLDEVSLPLSKTVLSEYLLINRTTLSIELKKMEQDGLIALNGRQVRILGLF